MFGVNRSGCGRPFLLSTSMYRVWLMPYHLDISDDEVEDEEDEEDEDAEDEDDGGDSGGMSFGLLNILSS